jgi:hypothetical protein
MTNKSNFLRLLTLSSIIAGFVLISGQFSEAAAQTRDPFGKPAWAKKNDAKPGMPGTGAKKGPAPVIDVGPPPIDQRIEFYKRLRESAAANGQPLPKVTSVLTLGEMAITGIFRTPRGYAAIVEAMPIKLSYTIYPGEKFFDGQLVAVEENRLVFRKVTKMSNGKFVATVENKPLRQYSDREQIQGTAPVQAGPENPAPSAPPVQTATADGKPASPAPIVSPLDEMNRQVQKEEPAKAAKTGKKPVKVARKK